MTRNAEQLADAFRQRQWEAVADLAETLLRDISRNVSSVVATAHPLGFVHLLIWENTDGSRIRLHLWPSDLHRPQEPAWTVHQHAWQLTSFVVHGRIRDDRYVVRDSPDGDRRVYTTAYTDGCSMLRAQERRVTCQLRESAAWARGSRYCVPTGTFHASRAEVDCVTLVESGPPSGADPLVIGAADGPQTVVYERRPLSANDLLSLLEGVTSSA